MTGSAQGIDISAYQAVYTAAELAQYSFAFFRATVGATQTDTNFADNWANAKTAGIHRGAYHELEPTTSASAASQAAYFIAAVKAQGTEAGDMLAVVASDYTGVTGAEVLAWLEAVRAAFPQSPAIVYSDLSTLPDLADCTAYPLWAAWPGDTAPASVSPWTTWTFWQWADTTLDMDAYNGTAAQLETWLDTYVPDPDDWVFGPVRDLALVNAGYTSVSLSWSSPDQFDGTPPSPAPGISYYEVAVCKGTELTSDVDSYPRQVPKVDGVSAVTWQGGSLAESTTYIAAVRACAAGSATHAGPWATVIFTTEA